jgi:hypothetical protein
MKKKLFTFTYALAFIAENEPDAEKQLQKELNFRRGQLGCCRRRSRSFWRAPLTLT